MAIFVNKQTFTERNLNTAVYKNDPEWVIRKEVLSKSNIVEYFTMPNIERKYMKWVSNKVEEMSQAEKDVVDVMEADAQAQAEADSKDITVSLDKLVKAFALTVLDEINQLRQVENLPVRTVNQLRSAVSNKYDTL